jgi:hypothetical protein
VPDSSDFPLSEAELVFLRELVRSKTRFLVVGLGAAVLQGADAVTQDLDIWFPSLGDPAIANAARAAGGVFAARTSPPMIAGEGLERIDVVAHCDGLKNFDAEYAKALKMKLADFSIRILPLERVIVSKRAAGRPKDKAALESLRAALVARRATPKRRI